MENKGELSRCECHTEPRSTGSPSQSPGPGLTPLRHAWRDDNREGEREGGQNCLCSTHHTDAFQLRLSDGATLSLFFILPHTHSQKAT